MYSPPQKKKNAFFDSHMRYAFEIWGKIQSKKFDMIQRAQNKALRIVSFK